MEGKKRKDKILLYCLLDQGKLLREYSQELTSEQNLAKNVDELFGQRRKTLRCRGSREFPEHVEQGAGQTDGY